MTSHAVLHDPDLRAPMPLSAGAREALYTTGHSLLQDGKVADGSGVFRTLTTFAPDDERGYLGLAACLEVLGAPAAALLVYETGAQTAHPSVRCAVGRARVLRGMGRAEEASSAWEDADALARHIGDTELCALVAQERSAS